MTSHERHRPTAVLALQDGTVFAGHGLGHPGVREGELVFNTAVTGYQEILTDPSYAGQIVTFTFPHVGNVGTNDEDTEARAPLACGLVLRAAVSEPSSWRDRGHLGRWLESNGLAAITGVDTRRITRLLREGGAQNAALAYDPDGRLDIEALKRRAAAWPGLAGMDLARDASARQRYGWQEAGWSVADGYAASAGRGPHVVAIDYGVKHNILRSLAARDCRVTVVPADTDAEAVLALAPDGIVIANGPGDPAATGSHAVPTIKALLDSGKPMFGICLGHQLLALALGARTEKMPHGHHGANHPVQDLLTGKVEITSQNHGFAVADGGLPPGLEVTHRSLFDGTIQGIRATDRPAFSVQYHPEASPGPHDSGYLFDRFLDLIGDKPSR